ncbi:hypothetical protein PSPHG_CDS_0103 [Pseudomonas phage Psxphi15]
MVTEKRLDFYRETDRFLWGQIPGQIFTEMYIETFR